MTKRFLPYFGSILSIHAAIILGWSITYSQMNSAFKLGPQSMRIKVASEELLKIKPPTPQKKIRPTPKQVSPEKVTPLETPVQDVTQASQSLSDTAKADLRSVYISELRSQIEANKSYPLISRRLGHTGLVVVGFTLLADGSIINIRVVKEARFERLSESALAAVRKIGRYKPIPEELQESQIDLTIPVKFTLQ